MSQPYGKDAQIFTFGVHGTENTPKDVEKVTQRISAAIGKTTDGANLWDNGFDWRGRTEVKPTYDVVSGTVKPGEHPVAGTAHLRNGTEDREIASKRLATHVLNQVDKAIENGSLDRNKALTINLVGFSHGGNVSILASDEISEGLKKRGIDSAIHLTTLSTPAYTWGKESPTEAKKEVEKDGVKFAHTHFSTPGDGVIRLAVGNGGYGENGVTHHHGFKDGVGWLKPISNHGAVQNSDPHMNEAAEVMRKRFNGLTPIQQRADASGLGEDSPKIASANTGRESSGSAATLVQGNESVNRQFLQALKGTNGDIDAAARAVETISKLPGYKLDQEIAVLQGTKGLIVSQGQGDTALNASIPQAKAGDFERIADQFAKDPQSPEIVATRPSQPEAKRVI
jgi:hypothetical protein